MFFKREIDKKVTGLKVGEWVRVYGTGGQALWATPCSVCGKAVTNWKNKKGINFMCGECREKERESDKANKLNAEINRLEKLKYIEKAKKEIINQYGDYGIYIEPLEKLLKHVNKPLWLQSTNEVLAAAELIRTHTRARHQVQMGKWRVDFLLPDLKVALEIDGGFHKLRSRQKKDYEKDFDVRCLLGAEWEVIHIKECWLKYDLMKLVPAIKGLAEERRKIRKAHDGKLPKYYSNTAI